MKLLVSTSGPFQLCGPGLEQWARHNRASVVRPSNFINVATSKGQLKVLGQLSDEATDEGFVATLVKGNDHAAAAAAYAKAFAWVDPAAPKVEPEPEPAKGAAKGAAKAAG